MIIRSGATTGPYRWIRFLGEGASAEVWAAERDGRQIAVKAFKGSQKRSFVEAIRRETRIGELITGIPGVVAVEHVETLDGHIFLEMEYVRGPSLDQVLQGRLLAAKGPIPVPIAVTWCVEMLDALEEVGKRVAPKRPGSFLHRDIKPGNLLLRPTNGRICVTDFGVARAEVELGFEATATGVVKGSPRFMAPEAILEEPMDARSDQYTVAVVLYELVTGLPLYSGADVAEILVQVAEARIGDSLDNVPGPAELRTILRTMLSRDADGRYPTHRDASFALSDLSLGGPAVHLLLKELVADSRTREGARLFDEMLSPIGGATMDDDEDTLVAHPDDESTIVSEIIEPSSSSSKPSESTWEPTDARMPRPPEADDETEVVERGALLDALQRLRKPDK